MESVSKVLTTTLQVTLALSGFVSGLQVQKRVVGAFPSECGLFEGGRRVHVGPDAVQLSPERDPHQSACERGELPAVHEAEDPSGHPVAQNLHSVQRGHVLAHSGRHGFLLQLHRVPRLPVVPPRPLR